MLTFEPFRIWCVINKKRRTKVREECDLAAATVAKIWKDEMPFRSDVLEKICRTYGLRVEQVIEYREEGQE